MKKVIAVSAFALFGVIALSSCKKDYTCTCTLGGLTSSETQNMKKADAEAWCDANSANAALLGGSCSLN